MEYNQRIIRIFTEMPAFDDSQLQLDAPSQKEKHINNIRLKNLTRINKTIKKITLKDNLSIELLENREATNFIVYLVKNENGVRTVCGELNVMEEDFPFPAVEMSYIIKDFQGKGYSKIMYSTIIKYLGGLVSDKKLTGEKTHGSFDIWHSLGKELYSYIISTDTNDNYKIKEVGNFDKSMVVSQDTRFMVSIDEFDQNEY